MDRLKSPLTWQEFVFAFLKHLPCQDGQLCGVCFLQAIVDKPSDVCGLLLRDIAKDEALRVQTLEKLLSKIENTIVGNNCKQEKDYKIVDLLYNPQILVLTFHSI